MDFVNTKTEKKADLTVIPFWKKGEKAVVATTQSFDKKALQFALTSGDFVGKEGETAVVYSKGGRLVALGLGEKDKVDLEALRRSYAALAKLCRCKKWTTLNLALPQVKGLIVETGVADGLLLANYSFDKLKNVSLKSKPTTLLKKVFFLGATATQVANAKKLALIIEGGVNVTRDLVNGNADDVTPQHLAATARSLGRKYASIKTTVFDKKRITKEKMGLLLAVARASDKVRDPAFIIISYKGAPRSKQHTVLVGKGITYDTGGLNLKPTGFMEDMKTDMSGAATVMGTMSALAATKAKVNVTGVIATTENAIGSLAYKPGDVYTSYLGKTVEIANTDAEGRLILADALAYTVKKLKPTRIVDFATLTGSMVIALGKQVTGFMSNDDALSEELSQAGDATYERMWRMPLVKEYRKLLDSDIADLKNCGNREAGSITAALFLKEFVGETPWAHCDIAGTADTDAARDYHGKGGTGVGVRLMLEFLK